MNHYLLGIDILGAELKVFVDKDTVRRVQLYLLLLNESRGDNFDLGSAGADGIIGPKTRAAVEKYNRDYRFSPQDGSMITEATLESMMLSPLGVPVTMMAGEGVIGVLSDGLPEYMTGQLQVLEMNRVFNLLNRPQQFEAEAEAIYAAYEKAKSNETALQWKNASDMKAIGAQAAALMGKLKPLVNPATGGTLDPATGKPKPDVPWYEQIPTWGWVAGGAALGLMLVTPLVLLARKAA